MFVKSRDYGKYIFTQKIPLGKEFGFETEEEVYITLRELDTKSVLKLKEAGNEDSETASLEVFREILPTLIVDHNFYETEEKKMNTAEVTNLLFEKVSTVGKVLTALKEKNFFR